MSAEPLKIDELIEAIRTATRSEGEFLALHEPLFAGNEWHYVKECLDTGWVSSVGKYVDLFEQKLEAYTGVHKAVAVVNGTAALHLALKLVGVRADDEVLLPALTFVATANAVAYCGAVPHFVDCDPVTLGVDAAKLRAYLSDIAASGEGSTVNRLTGRPIRALIVMHTFGHPADTDALAEVCADYGLELVEDAAESLGSFYKGKHTGLVGKAAALSFNGNKIVTTGGGGALLTNDEELGRLAKHWSTTAKVPHAWEYVHDAIGYNYRLPNLNAAVGCAQLEQLDGFILHKRRLTERYAEALSGIAGVSLITEPAYGRSNYWLQALRLDREYQDKRDEVLAALNGSGLMARPVWKPLHQLPMYAACPRMDLDATSDLESRIINLPSSVKLGGEPSDA